MKNFLPQRMKPLIFFAVLVLVAVVFALYSFPRRAAAPENKIPVVATIFPLYDLVQFIGSDYVDVTLLLPEGESPDKLATVNARTDFSKSRIVFAIGHDFDTAGLPDQAAAKVVTVDKNIDLLLSQGSTASPYYWLSVKQAPHIAQTIADSLSSIDPAHAGYYAGRLTLLNGQLAALDKIITELFAKIPQKQLLVYGYDWSYFARDYGLDIVYYLPGIAGGSIADVEQGEALDAIDKYGSTALFSDIRFSPEPLLTFMTQRPGLSIVNLDILGGVENRKSYGALMGYNAQTIFGVFSQQLRTSSDGG